jgi:protease IV
MLQFLKYVLATIIGLFLFIFLGFFVLIGIGSMFSSSDSDKYTVKANSVLQIDLNTSLTEKTIKEDQFSEVFANNESKTSIIDLKNAIQNAKLDPNIKAISLKLEMPMASFAQLEDLRNELIEFKKSGKKIYTYAEIMTEKAIYLSTVADQSFINTVGGIEFNGLESETVFLKGLFEKVGVKPQIFKVGDFKSAVEPFIRTDMSPENELQVKSYLGSISEHIYSQIATSRGINRADLENILNQNLIQEPSDAVKYKLVSNVGYFDQYEDKIKSDIGLKSTDKISYVSLGKYKTAKSYIKEGSNANKIAVIISEGEIQSGDAEGEVISSEAFIKDLKRARNDKKVKAIVLRIDSPGGSALASDIMWREIQLTKKVKPVIASMGSVAASGGYYMAMGCDTIVAHPTTITGSIGIFGMIFNIKELLNSKLGITTDVVTTHQFANSPSMTTNMSEAEKNMIQRSVEKGYETFTSKAALGRKMPIEKLKSVASGRVWTGLQAKENGLVDVLGNLDQAIAIAAKKAKLGSSDYQVKYYPYPKSELEQILKTFGKSKEDALIKEKMGVLYPYFTNLKGLQNTDRLQARVPFTLEIK